MATLLMNKTLDNLVMGVSEQYREGRREGQMQEMINCSPSITRGVLRRNPISMLEPLTGLATISSDAFTYAYDRGNGDEQYILVIEGDALGTWYIYNVNDTTKHWTGTDNYLKIPVGTTARKLFKAITLRDYTFIVNTSITVDASSTVNTLPTADYTDKAFYWIKQVTQVVVAQETVATDSGSLLKGYTYTLNGQSVEGVSETRPSETAIDRLSADKIITELASLDASWVTATGSSMLWQLTLPTQWEWEDTAGSTASLGVWKNIATADDLPARLPAALDGFIVKITGNTSQTKDDYWLRYNNTDSTWDEVSEPGISVGLDVTTMPHIFYRLVEADGVTPTFVFDEYKEVATDGKSVTATSLWKTRDVGDVETNPDPSFVANTISDIFFYKNRLGFTAGNTVVLSTIRDYGGLYIRSIQTILDDGPIDLTIATTNSTTLRRAIATEDTLLFFSDDDQFLLHSYDEVLTPITATITAVSHYNYNKDFPALAVGSNVLFSAISGAHAQLYELSLNSQDLTGSNIQAENISLHLPSYLSSDMDTSAADTGVGQTFIRAKSVTNLLYVINTSTLNREKVQQAFHKWVFNDDIVGVHTINNKLFLVFENGTLGSMDLDLPGDMTTISYQDMTTNNTTFIDYTSAFELSTIYYTGKDQKGTVRGRLQLRTMQYGIGDDSAFKTILHTTNKVKPLEVSFGPTWEDTYININDVEVPTLWDDTATWTDTNPSYDRVYYDDKKVTVMAGSEYVSIVFTSNELTPSKGFELETINIEALFYQRSSRVIS
jgi:hypothetical protein